MDWTYTNILRLSKLAYFDYTKLTPGDAMDRLIELYLLGDVLDDVKLRNSTLRFMTAAIEDYSAFLHPVQCRYVWQHTAPSSSIRKWVVDHIASLVYPEFIKNGASELPADLVLQIADMLMARRAMWMYGARDVLEQRLKTYMEVEDDP